MAIENCKILQILPPGEWMAVYTDDDDKPPMKLPLVCWALIEFKNGEQSVVGMDGGDYVDFAENSNNFYAYEPRPAPCEGVDLEVIAEKAAWREAERRIDEEDAREEELANGQFGVGA